ncbi:MAG: DUF4157 domain-containing protein [Draconibacterium sp.]
MANLSKISKEKTTISSHVQANSSKSKRAGDSGVLIDDRRPETKMQAQLGKMAQNHVGSSGAVQLKRMGNASVAQRQENKTGLPDNLKSGIEGISGYSMDDVKVHRNSGEPAKVQAHAFAQGSNIHLAPGQEKHLPHEAWHVVQQKQGRVQPTMQMRGAVNVNDDPGLEKEADVMGEKALQMKPTPGVVAKKKSSLNPIQRVKNEDKRPETDLRITELKKEVINILTIMKELGEDWELKYGEKGKEKARSKAKDLLEGKKTDYQAEIRRAALKQLWGQLSTEQKIEMIGEAAKLGLEGVKAVGQSSLGLSELPDFSGGSKPKEKEKKNERKPRSERKEESDSDESSLSVSWLSSLDSEDLELLYNMNKKRKKLLDKIAEAKSEIVEGAGDIGERVGSEIGKLRDEVDFDKRMKAQRQAFLVARKRYEMLKAVIEENDDVARYQNELDALFFAIKNKLHGPAMVYSGNGLNDEGRKRHPGICKDAIINLKLSTPVLRGGVVETASNAFSAIGSLVYEAVRGMNPDQDQIDTAKTDLVNEINRVAGKSWGSFTFWAFTPSGVSKIKKDMPRDKPSDEQLSWAKQIAAEAAAMESKNRSPETQIFYDAIANVETNDLTNIQKSISIIREIGSKLG